MLKRYGTDKIFECLRQNQVFVHLEDRFQISKHTLLDLSGVKTGTCLLVCVCFLYEATRTAKKCKTCFIQVIGTDQLLGGAHQKSCDEERLPLLILSTGVAGCRRNDL